ncbi:MAG: DUF3737 family protein [Clostridiales bacterium]|nr:DUF3737 family protein [Clostridiales bacterium]
MKITDRTFGEERALYGENEIELENCRFEGEEDGESALKECGDVKATGCYFDLRYPLWHDRSVELDDCTLTEKCRAALWYTENIRIRKSKLLGIKAVRECSDVGITESEIVSPEFGWSTENIFFRDVKAISEYFMLRAKNITAQRLDFKGKYSFQYIENAEFDDCYLDTKDAFWHGKNITVRNSVVKGEYLGWFSKKLTFINCEIIGTQPLCYCKGLKLIDCTMNGCDLSFERSDVYAVLHNKVDSIKNPYKGVIKLPEVGEIIRDDANAKAKIILDESLNKNER